MSELPAEQSNYPLDDAAPPASLDKGETQPPRAEDEAPTSMREIDREVEEAFASMAPEDLAELHGDV